MFSASVASSLFSTVTSALGSKAAASLTSQSGTQPFGATQSGSASSQSNNPTGTTNPFQSLSADMQSWLTQNQSTSGTQTHHHHDCSGAQQTAGQSNTGGSADPTATAASGTGTGTA